MALMDILNAFRSGSQQGPQQPVNPDPAASANPDPSKNNALVPGDSTAKSDGTHPAFPKAGDGDKSPLENFKDLWDKSDKDAKPLDQLVTGVSIPTDPNKILEAAKQVDFTKAIPADLLKKASEGDSSALGQVINHAAQLGYAQSTASTAKIIEAALGTQAKKFREEVIPEVMRRERASQAIQTENAALYEDPAIKPMVEMLEQRFTAKYPTSPASEITKMAKEYLSGFATKVVAGSGKQIVEPTTSTTKAAPETDWEKFFSA